MTRRCKRCDKILKRKSRRAFRYCSGCIQFFQRRQDTTNREQITAREWQRRQREDGRR